MKEIGIVKRQQNALRALSGKMDNFYLAGGTALSLFYFRHRLSVDLDFFTPRFSANEVKNIMKFLCKETKVKIRLAGQSLGEKYEKIMVYEVYFTDKDVLKIDFVEDVHRLIKKPKLVDGIKILPLEDIYMRKIYTLTGYIEKIGKIGQSRLAGGRSDAKDFYDVYCLSHIFMPLSKFAGKYCNAVTKEGLVSWFQTFDRMKIKGGILDLITDKKLDYRNLEKHFKKEIDKIAEQEIGRI